jgi:AcrR family transcriptional regulator
MADTAEAKDRWTATKGDRDDRRDAIVAVAHQVFLEKGYAGTSMSAIAARHQGSKGTLYNYFSSKEELFAAVIERKCEQFMGAVFGAEVEGGDIRNALTRFAQRILETALSDDTIATKRLIAAECARFPEIGRAMFRSGPQRGREQMAKFLARAKDAGQLRADTDVALAAEQFFALCFAESQLPRLWNAIPMLTPDEIRKQAEDAVSTFLRAFGT